MFLSPNMLYMSLQTFKKKSVINYGSNRSAKPPGGIWLSQGPFGNNTTEISSPGFVGFSLNGGTRNVGYIGKSSAFSKSGTPFYGQFPKGSGGCCGTYSSPQPVMNSPIVRGITQGQQAAFIKPSVLSTYGMLDRKYRWAYYGVYPNRTVQPNYTGNQTDTASQRLYIENLASKNTCNLKVNNVGTYEGYKVGCGSTLCTPGRSTARFKYNDMARNAPYTKTLYQAVGYDQYNLKLAQKCQNPIGPQKPFPYAKAGGSSYAAAGTSIIHFGNAGSCGSTTNNYINPPEWYIRPTSTPNTAEPPQTTVFK